MNLATVLDARRHEAADVSADDDVRIQRHVEVVDRDLVTANDSIGLIAARNGNVRAGMLEAIKDKPAGAHGACIWIGCSTGKGRM